MGIVTSSKLQEWVEHGFPEQSHPELNVSLFWKSFTVAVQDDAVYSAKSRKKNILCFLPLSKKLEAILPLTILIFKFVLVTEKAENRLSIGSIVVCSKIGVFDVDEPG